MPERSLVIVGLVLFCVLGGLARAGGDAPSENDATFDSGSGLRLEYLRPIRRPWAWQVGLVHARWAGRRFVGGEFPDGVDFGDFGLTGVYGGFTARLRPGNEEWGHSRFPVSALTPKEMPGRESRMSPFFPS